MGAGDADSQHTNSTCPTWNPLASLTPLSRLGLCGRCWGPANSQKRSSVIFWLGFKSQRRRGGGLIRAPVRARYPCLPQAPFLGVFPSPLYGTPCPVRGYLLHLFFYVPAGLYSTDRHLLAFSGELPPEGLPPLMETPVDSFAVRRPFYAVPRDDNLVHVEGVPSLIWHTTTYERAGKHAKDSKDLACHGLTLLSPDINSCLLGQGANISKASCLLLLLLAS